jgi:hypothetical protein
MLLGGEELAFYQYNGDVNTLLDGVREGHMLFGVGVALLEGLQQKNEGEGT